MFRHKSCISPTHILLTVLEEGMYSATETLVYISMSLVFPLVFNDVHKQNQKVS